jgi:nitroreductase
VVPRDVFQQILETAVQAPSGDNSQPWRFVVKNNTFSVYNKPEKDNPVFNFKQSGSYIAIGCLLENIDIISREFGYTVAFDYFPVELDEPHLVARVRFEKADAGVSRDPLSSCIKERATNRKLYREGVLLEEELNTLRSANTFSNVMFRLVTDAATRRTLGKALSVTERVVLENRDLHTYFFRDVRWTEKEELEEKSGLYLKTLEFAPPQVAVFRLLSKWPIARMLSLVSFPSFIASENAKLYGSGSALGALVINDDSPKSFLFAGRAMQRVWLRVTSMGLSLQPVTGVVFLAQRVRANEPASLSKKHLELVRKAYAELAGSFKVTHGLLAMVFRIGDGGTPTARSSRKKPEILFE